jgi:decaprenyl-diphosphate synthase subunit 1
MIAEMIHTASLIHDDVIDKSDTRRGKEAANVKWGVAPAVMAGNYIIAKQSQILATFNNDTVSIIVSKIIEDLIHGELCQMESIESTHLGRYKQYLNKTYLKTASLIANSCEAVAVLNNCTNEERKAARDFGKNIGLAFQIQDDRLDFISDADKLGKPTCADLKLGLSTAPVLFASEVREFEMIPMMSRRFSKIGDVERAYDIIKNKSDALLRTRLEAEKYGRQAERLIPLITKNPFFKEKLKKLTVMVTNRDK